MCVMFAFLMLFLIGCSEKPVESEPDSFEVLVKSDFIKTHFKTSQIKIVFRDDNEGVLNLLEIDGDDFVLNQLNIDVDPYHPQFSPDGSKIAFCTGWEGVSVPSELFVIDISTPEGKTYKLEGMNAAIPRWRILENGDTAIVFNDYLGSDLNPAWSLSATYQVVYSKNTFGEPKKIMNRSYNGGVSNDNNFAVTGAPRLLFHHASDDDSVNVEMYNDEQVCNASLTRNSENIVSFLETRGEMGMSFTNDRHYFWHQYIFYMDSTGKLIKAIKGSTDGVFEHVEWLYYPGYQIASISNSGVSEYMVLIDYENSTYHKIVKALGMQLMHPDLWVPQK